MSAASTRLENTPWGIFKVQGNTRGEGGIYMHTPLFFYIQVADVALEHTAGKIVSSKRHAIIKPVCNRQQALSQLAGWCVAESSVTKVFISVGVLAVDTCATQI